MKATMNETSRVLFSREEDDASPDQDPHTRRRESPPSLQGLIHGALRASKGFSFRAELLIAELRFHYRNTNRRTNGPLPLDGSSLLSDAATGKTRMGSEGEDAMQPPCTELATTGGGGGVVVLEIGERVICRWKGGEHWFPGTVLRVGVVKKPVKKEQAGEEGARDRSSSSSQTPRQEERRGDENDDEARLPYRVYAVRYDDGDKEDGIRPENIRRLYPLSDEVKGPEGHDLQPFDAAMARLSFFTQVR